MVFDFRSCSTTLFALALAGVLHAQVVNIEGRRFMNDSVPWTGYVNFRFNVAENGQRSLGLGLTGAVQYIHGRDKYIFINDLAFSQVEASNFLNTGSLWTGEAFLQT